MFSQKIEPGLILITRKNNVARRRKYTYRIIVSCYRLIDNERPVCPVVPDLKA